MSTQNQQHSYYLRSKSSDKVNINLNTKQSSLQTSSPTSPTLSTSPPFTHKHTLLSNEKNPCIQSNQTKSKNTRNPRRRRKRRFCQQQQTEQQNHVQPPQKNKTELCPPNKKLKLTRTIKFTLNDEKIISREASLSATSSIIMAEPRKYYPRIESFEIPLHLKIASLRRNKFCCCYSFFNGYKIAISSTLGAGKLIADGIKILSQDLKSVRAKASISTAKNSFIVYILTRKNVMIGCCILHLDHIWKRVNIEMFAIDNKWRGNGFASMMIYLIQYRMSYYNNYDLFVCAANEALPFWTNKKYHFVLAHKNILEQHELEDEKNGNITHLIWYGQPIQARCALLNCFVQSQ